MNHLKICIFDNEMMELSVDEAITFRQLKKLVGDLSFVEEDVIYFTDKYHNLYSEEMILQDIKLGSGETIYANLKILGGGCRYKKSSSVMRWKWKLKRQRRLQRIRRKMRRRAR